MGNFIPSGFTNAHSSSNSISFNFEQDKPVLNQEKILFELYDGFDKETGLSISLFRYPSNKLTSNHLKSLAFNAVCKTKTIMIPETLKYFASFETNEGVFLVTERVLPLSSIIETLTSEEKVIGIYQIIKALSFLHTNAKIEHNNVCVDSIFVNPSDFADWRLGGFEFAFPKTSKESVEILKSTQSFQNSKAIPPEYTTNNSSFDLYPLGSRDSWSLGVLISEYLNLPPSNELTELLTKMKSDPLSRPSMSTLLQSSYFIKENYYAHIIQVLKELPFRSSQQNQVFFQELFSNLKQLPRNLLCKTILTKLKKYHTLVDSEAQHFLPHLFTIKDSNPNVEGLLDKEEWNKYMEDFVLWSFSQRDRRLRLVLLKNFDYYIHAFSLSQIEERIVPELVAGLHDRDLNLVEETLRAISSLYQYLFHINDSDKVREELLSDLMKVVKDHPNEEIRLNAFIRIGHLLQQKKCSENHVLNWFLTGVKSSNERIRLAAVCLVNTVVVSQFEHDVDQKIISLVFPLLTPLLIDSHSDVREQTYLVLRELAVGVLQRCGHSNLNSLQLKTITLNDIPTCSSSIKKIDKKLTTQKQKTIDSSQQKENSPLKEKSNEGSVSMSLSKDAANSIFTQESKSADNKREQNEKVNESKLEEERDLFEEFGMQPQVKSAPRITVSSPVKPPATALDSTTHRDTVTTTTTTPSRTRFYQVEDTDNFADQWFEDDWDADLQRIVVNEKQSSDQNILQTTEQSQESKLPTDSQQETVVRPKKTDQEVEVPPETTMTKTKDIQNENSMSTSQILRESFTIKDPQIQKDGNITTSPSHLNIVSEHESSSSTTVEQRSEHETVKKQQTERRTNRKQHAKPLSKKEKPKIERVNLNFDESEQ